MNVGLLWFGILGGPVMWGTHETVSYLMVPYVCATGMVFLLHVVTIVAVLITLAAGYCAFRAWISSKPPERTDMSGRRGRNAFMGLAGLATAGFFLLLILVESSGNYFFSPCEFRQGMPMGSVPASIYHIEAQE